MTVPRYRIIAGQLMPDENGDLCPYESARRDIEKLGNELFASNAALRALERQSHNEKAALNAVISSLRERIRQAGIALGYDDHE